MKNNRYYPVNLITVIILLIATTVVYSQVSFSDTTIAFGEAETGSLHSRTITVTNNSGRGTEFSASGFSESIFSSDKKTFFLAAGDQAQITINFSSEQNIFYKDYFVLNYKGAEKPQVITVSAQGVFSDGYYQSTRNKWGEQLKAALSDIVGNHTSLGYTTARDEMYGSIDNKNGLVECVYTGRKAAFNTRSGATSNSFNCEHTWPQGFFDKDEPMRSDIFHLYPTDINSNSRRGSYDFGIVQSVSWQEGGSKLGTDSQGTIVFEPRDVHKGNVARSHFYFIMRYGTRYNGYQKAASMEELFRNWHTADAVDNAEKERNEAISIVQKNRNPFIDHPQFADRIPSFFGSGNPAVQAQIAVWPDVLEMDTVGVNQSLTKNIAIINTGNGPLNLSSISSSNPVFTLNRSSANIAAESYEYFEVVFSGSPTEGSYSGTITINSNDPGQAVVNIPVQVEVDAAVGIPDPVQTIGNFALDQNYPNPFNPVTTISFSLKNRQAVSLFVYNVQGQCVSKIIEDQRLAPGRHAFLFNGQSLPSGIYYYQLRSASEVATKAFLLLK